MDPFEISLKMSLVINLILNFLQFHSYLRNNYFQLHFRNLWFYTRIYHLHLKSLDIIISTNFIKKLTFYFLFDFFREFGNLNLI